MPTKFLMLATDGVSITEMPLAEVDTIRAAESVACGWLNCYGHDFKSSTVVSRTYYDAELASKSVAELTAWVLSASIFTNLCYVG